ncbi:Y-family DNA polymerase [Paenibacillus sp. Aloe-11]|uniref:Y-family DNA polymerase n=1 Tax=Paenibacillus sp. Aloe-11 TaxID=1050222 RepID=UPI00024F05A4|nr:hypothetical protein [Paenibacillus sp. Aloe-11]EHS55491.1 hypothetical protein WG8_4351 [Paenibacillus sp. Aloe-11]
MFVYLDSIEHAYAKTGNAAVNMKQTILPRTGIIASIGIGPNKFISKVIQDTKAKYTGITEYRYEDVLTLLWLLRVEEV